MSPFHAHQTRVPGVPEKNAPVIRVYFCGRPLLRRGLEQIYEGTRFVVQDPVFYGPAQYSEYGRHSPELFIVDGTYHPSDIVEMISELKALHSGSYLILLADQLDASTVFAAREAGADGIFLTSSSPNVLVRSMQLVLLGEVIVSSELIRAAMGTPVCDPEPPAQHIMEEYFDPSQKKVLSNREVEVLHWLKEGAPNKLIARKLNVAEATIKVHVKAILRKINAGNRSQAAIWATHNMVLKAARP